MRACIAKIREAVVQSFLHDVVNTAKAAAYSGMLTFFPALLVITTLIAQVDEGPTAMGEIRSILEQFLPADTLDLIQSSILTHHLHSVPLILSTAGLSLFAGMGVMLSLMEGFRRAYRLPVDSCWGFWKRRIRALLLVPVALVPLALASLAIVFGRQIEQWTIDNARHELRHIVVLFWRITRWSVCFAAIVAVFMILYHFGTRRMERWFWVAPGAIAGTFIWFPSTLAYGWYVTRVADYSRIYGSFGAGVASLVWLYITTFSILIGAELNGVFYGGRQSQKRRKSAFAPSPQLSPN